jgi:hypothetical protein
MAEAFSDTVIPEDYDYKTPEHLIIWLDAHIGDPEKYHNLKKSFSNNIDPRSQTLTKLTDEDIDNLLRVGEAISVCFGGVLCLLLAFTDPDLCYQAFQIHHDKRILFITSGSLGRRIVPDIIQNFQKIFTDPVTNDPYSSIYIFCLDIPLHYSWAMEYYEYVQMFDHEADLLARMTRDMAEYYFTQAERQRVNEHLKEALRTYLWSKKLYLHYKKMNEPCQKYIDDINRITQEIKNTLQSSRQNYDYDMHSGSDNENYGESAN